MYHHLCGSLSAYTHAPAATIYKNQSTSTVRGQIVFVSVFVISTVQSCDGKSASITMVGVPHMLGVLLILLQGTAMHTPTTLACCCSCLFALTAAP
jgi:hypothetical protein